MALNEGSCEIGFVYRDGVMGQDILITNRVQRR